MTSEIEKNIAQAVAMLRTRFTVVPAVALILGSGLGDLADRIEGAVRVEYNDIPHFMTSKVHGHKNCLVVGKLAGAFVDFVCAAQRVWRFVALTMKANTHKKTRVAKAST